MRRFDALFKHQIHLMFISASTYFAAFLFLAFMGIMYVLALMDVSSVGGSQSATEKFLSVFWVPVLFMVPLLTMRSLSEERRMGTLGTLMSTPIRAWQIVAAKFLACYFFYVLLWLLTLVYMFVAQNYLPQGLAGSNNFAPAQVFTGYLFIFVSGLTYIAIGIFASSLTRTTFVAGMLSFAMLFFAIVGSGIISKFVVGDAYMSWLSGPMEYMQTFKHLEDFSNSLLDTRPFFFYISTACLLLGLTSLITESKSS